MYFGESYTSVDERGRVNIPKELRTQIDKHATWFVTRGFDRCLFLFDEPTWNDMTTQMSARSVLDPKSLDFRRFLLGGATPVAADNQGRFLIPAPLRDFSEIERDAAMVGVGDHVELWSKRLWKEYQQNNAGNYKNMAGELFGASPASAAVSAA